jgi:hypothetical protein
MKITNSLSVVPRDDKNLNSLILRNKKYFEAEILDISKQEISFVAWKGILGTHFI